MAMLTFNSVSIRSKAEIAVEDSKFIGVIKQISSEDEAKIFLEELKKQYPNARHICYAYSFYSTRTKAKKEKQSDNGEPEGTAGTPIMSAIKKNNLGNVVLAVVRIFGGTLLGTGLLTRSYAQIAEKTVKNASLISVSYMGIYSIICSYAEAKRVLDVAEDNNIKVLETEYEEDVQIVLAYSESEIKKLQELLNKTLNKKVSIKKIESRFV